MTEVATTVGTSYLYAGHTERFVFVSIDGPWNSIEESRPSTAARKLGIALVKWSPTSSARINTPLLVVFILSSARAFRALLTENPKLLWGQNCPPL
jgi:hypothetical protein